MPERLEQWIYIGVVTEAHNFNGVQRNVGDLLGVITAPHPAGWSPEGWGENEVPHPFASYHSGPNADKIDVMIIDPESLPDTIDNLEALAKQEKKTLAKKIHELYLSKGLNPAKSQKSDGTLTVKADVKKPALVKEIVQKDEQRDVIEKDQNGNDIIVTKTVNVKRIEKRVEKQLLRNQDVRIPRGCRFAKLNQGV